jgi:hypothetical protein
MALRQLSATAQGTPGRPAMADRVGDGGEQSVSPGSYLGSRLLPLVQ